MCKEAAWLDSDALSAAVSGCKARLSGVGRPAWGPGEQEVSHEGRHALRVPGINDHLRGHSRSRAGEAMTAGLRAPAEEQRFDTSSSSASIQDYK
jgi:hypothetical protein